MVILVMLFATRVVVVQTSRHGNEMMRGRAAVRFACSLVQFLRSAFWHFALHAYSY